MTEAWIVRDMARQKLRQELMWQVWEAAAEEAGGRFLLRLAEAIVAFLNHKSRRDAPVTRANEFFFEKIVPRINEFARTPAENRALLAMFLEKDLLPSALNHYYAVLQLEEFKHPELVFHAPSAMSEMAEEDGEG
ncbi:MAG: hypothetical protein HYS89_02200 [Candidatus Colwellbacteria bacterium]|nr:hypothetical protein [Candidatus Colwellbacteria bacterium]